MLFEREVGKSPASFLFIRAIPWVLTVTATGDEDGCLCNSTFVLTAEDDCGLPHKILEPYVGDRITSKAASGMRLDKWGHALRSRSHPGGHSRCGYQMDHDSAVHMVAQTCKEAGIPCQVEPRGLLTSNLPAAARARAAAAPRNDNDPERRAWKQAIIDLLVLRGGGVTLPRHTT